MYKYKIILQLFNYYSNDLHKYHIVLPNSKPNSLLNFIFALKL